jgi:hypothetical protein
MNWEAIGAVAEILGAAGVILTLLYLATQIRESRRATQSVVIWEKAKAARDMGLVWSTTPEATALMFEYGQCSENEFNEKFEQNPERSFQYLAMNRSTVELLQAIYLTADKLDEQKRLEFQLRHILETIPGFRWVWPKIDTPGAFHPEFSVLVRSELKRLKLG